MSPFGELLRTYRHKSTDPRNPARKLSQERLGQLLGTELNDGGFSGAAVSDWERGVSKIHADQRRVLTGLIRVLYERGGIETFQEANQLLEAGNYRVLNLDEMRTIFPEGFIPGLLKEPGQPGAALRFIAGSFFSISDQELGTIRIEADKGPLPAWPRILVSLIARLMSRWPQWRVARGVAWLWIWLLCWALLAPSLKWPFADQETAKLSITIYSAGALIIPLLIGLLTITRGNEFWEIHKLANSPITRFYTYQGASIGYHLGCFVVFTSRLLTYYSHVNFSIVFQVLLAALPLLIGYAGANLVPYNLWQAYGRLSLKDGWIFSVFFVLGPVWGFYFYNFYPVFLSHSVGVLTALMVLTFFMILTLLQRKNQRR